MSSLFAKPSSYKCICVEFLLRSLVNEKRILFSKYFQLTKNNILNKEESRRGEKKLWKFLHNVSNLNVIYILYTQVLLHIYIFYIFQK